MDLKKIRPQAVPEALERARRYRLLNEPAEAESICRDVLAIEPAHQEAIETLLLALTDMFPRDYRLFSAEARALLDQISSEYGRAYYAGVIEERAAKALLAAGYSGDAVHTKVADAMAHFERAIPLSTGDTDEAVLRWNACVRMIRRHKLEPDHLDETAFHVESFDDEVPHR